VPSPVGKPSNSLASGLVIPLVAVLGMSGFFFMGGFGQGDRTILVVALVAIGLGSAVPVVWMFVEDRRRLRRRAREQVEHFERRLRNAELELVRLRAEEQALRTEQDPAPPELVDRAIGRGRRLWERRPTDDDFLQLRLGVGMASTQLQIVFDGGVSSSLLSSESDAYAPKLVRLIGDARLLAEQYHQVPNVPVCFDLRAAGAVGIAGPRARATALARAVMCQATVHHSPEDLRIVGFVSSAGLDDWGWLKWLPHARGGGESPAMLAWDAATHASLSRWLIDDLMARKRALEEAGGRFGARDDPLQAPWLLVFVDDLRGVHADPALRMVLAEGMKLRVVLLGVADSVAALPGGCRGVAEVESGVEPLVTYAETRGNGQSRACVADGIDVLTAEQLARALAPLVVVDEGIDGQTSDIPSRVTLFEALGIASIENLKAAHDFWRPATPTSLLRTPLGPTSGGELLWLDLKEQSQGGHGPHGLIAGTTGAGKSELLLTMIAGLALRHPPDVLNFALVDYKGGDAFQSVADLPHTVAVITDLDRHLAARALLTLRSEIKRREHRLLELRAAGISSVAEFQLRHSSAAGAEPMPYLVIFVDEFARLKDDLPEFISGLIDVARVGRSLGVHLILATQTPSGTVDDQIQRNSNFGISLRVRDPSDSKEVIGETDAALLPGAIPGRAYFRAGLDPMRLFQTARVRAPYVPRSTSAALEIRPFEPVRHVQGRGVSGFAEVRAVDGTEVEALVRHLRLAATELGAAARVWPPPLPDLVPLFDTVVTWSEDAWLGRTTDDWLHAPVGVIDEPVHQAQGPFRLDVGRNCIVYGAPGSGKSTLLRTLATSLAAIHAPRDLHLYCLDFDARTLVPLAGLPHCGETGVFLPRDTLRIRRLMRHLQQELAQRREAGVSNLRQQRGRLGPHADAFERFPFVVVLLDNYAAFKETFEEEEELTRSPESMLADLASLMRDGPAAGIYFVIAAGAVGSLSSSIANAVETRVALRQTDTGDYVSVVGRIEQLPEHVPPGRGFVAGNPPREFQVALLPDEADAALGLADNADVGRTANLFGRLRVAAGSTGPVPIEDLPTWLSLDDRRLASVRRGRLPVVLGLDDERSAPLVVDLADLGHVVIAGPPGAGKTSLLASILLQARDGVGAFFALPRPSPLSELASSATVARNVVQLGEVLDELEGIVDERREALRGAGRPSDDEVAQIACARDADASAGDRHAPLLLVLDDYELLCQDDDFMDVESRLARVARRGASVGLHVLVAGSNVELRDSRDDLLRYVSQLRVGVLLQPDVEFDGDLFSVRLRRFVDPPPPGRGYLVMRQQQVLFQAATPQLEGEPLAASLRRRLASAHVGRTDAISHN